MAHSLAPVVILPSHARERKFQPKIERPAPFLWSRSETLGLANQQCARCWGMGLVPTVGKGKETACNCVYRKIFTICHNRFRKCVEHENAGISSVYGNERSGPLHRHRYGFRNEEFMADFLHIAGQALGEGILRKIFKWHYLLGADFRLVNRKLGRKLSDRYTFHDFYKIEEIVGRAFRETYPYSLFPLDEYFGGTVRKAKVIPFPTAVPA